jgi:hypothetical protein
MPFMAFLPWPDAERGTGDRCDHGLRKVNAKPPAESSAIAEPTSGRGMAHTNIYVPAVSVFVHAQPLSRVVKKKLSR